MFLLAAAAAAIAIATAPNASAAPGEPRCSDAGGATDCVRQDDQEIYASPRPVPRVFPPTINPRYRGNGYSARFPEYGFDPKWQSFGYNPLYSGFQPRPSVLRPPQLPTSQTPNATDTGGSTTYQTTGNAQLTAQIGPAAQNADQQATFFPVPSLPALAGPTGLPGH
jgi:hypothetical protein